MGFFAGLLPGAMSSRTSLVQPPPEPGSKDPVTSQDGSPSPSPLTNRTFQRRAVGGSYDLADVEQHTPSILTSSIESLGEHTLRLNRPYDSRINNPANTINLHAPQSYHSERPALPHRNTTPFSHNSQQMQKQPSRSSLHLQAIQQQHLNMVSPRSPRASAYMRHMPSASMPHRPDSTPAHISRPAIFITDDDHDSGSTQPPLPPSWLESVARAVLFGGTGAYIGGPSSFASHHGSLTGPSSPSFAKRHVLRSTRSSLSQVSSRRTKHHRQPMNRRSGLTDQTNSPITPPTSGSRDSFFGPPPSLFSQIERGRARRSEGEVSRDRKSVV